MIGRAAAKVVSKCVSASLALAVICLLPSPAGGGRALAETLGKLSFDVPPGWTCTLSRDSARLAPSARPAAGTFCSIEVKADWDYLRGPLEQWFNRQWDVFWKSGEVLDGTPPEAFSVPGYPEALVSTAAVEGRSRRLSCRMLAMYAAGGRYSEIRYYGNSLALFKAHRPLFVALCKSVRFAGGSDSPARSAQSAQPTQPKPEPNTPQAPGGLGPTKQALAYIPDRMPTLLAMPAGSADDAAKDLAKLTLAGSKDSFAAFVTATSAAGFTIRDERGVTWQRPRVGKGVGLNVSDWELMAFYAMLARGFSLPYDGFCSAYEYALQQLGVQDPQVAPTLAVGLRRAMECDDPSQRFYARYIVELGRQSRPAQDMLAAPQDKSLTLNPVQYLLLSCELCEGIRLRIHQAYSRGIGRSRVGDAGGHRLVLAGMPSLARYELASEEEPGELPGWAEDGVVLAKSVVDTLLLDKLVKAFETLEIPAGERLEWFGKATGIANALGAMVKCAATYLTIESEFSLDKPAPLIRHKLVREGPGEQRVLTVTLRSNPPAILQRMKQLRLYLIMLGVDTDMPRAGPFADCKVEWRFPEFRAANALQYPVEFHHENLYLAQTDTEGNASVIVEGVQQRRDKERAAPIPRRVPVQVLLQVKKPEIKQDTVDALGGAFSVASGAGKGGVDILGFLTPMYEMLYRSRWLAPQQYVLKVRDWGFEGWQANYQVRIAGRESSRKGVAVREWHVHRVLTSQDFLLMAAAKPEVPGVEDDGKTDYFQVEPHSPAYEWDDDSLAVDVWAGCNVDASKSTTVAHTVRRTVKAPGVGARGTTSTPVDGVKVTVQSADDPTGSGYSIRLPSDAGYGRSPNAVVVEETSVQTDPTGRGVSGPAKVTRIPARPVTFFRGLRTPPGPPDPMGQVGPVPLPFPRDDGGLAPIEGSKEYNREVEGFGPVKVSYRWHLEWVSLNDTASDAAARARRVAKWQEQGRQTGFEPAAAPRSPWTSPQVTPAAARMCVPTDPGPIRDLSIVRRAAPGRHAGTARAGIVRS